MIYLLLFSLIASLTIYAFYLHRKLRAVHEDLRYVHRSHRIRLEKIEERCKELEEHQPAPEVAMPDGPSWFSPRMTIQDALSQHPGVKDVLASMHIGGCSSCSVSSKETLAEAAQGHGVDLKEMLTKMNALMGDAPPPEDQTKGEEDGLTDEEFAQKRAADSLPPANGGRVMLGIGKVPSREEE